MDEALKERAALSDMKKKETSVQDEISSDEGSKPTGHNNGEDNNEASNSKNKRDKESSDNEQSPADGKLYLEHSSNEGIEMPTLKSVKSEPQETNSAVASSDEKLDKKFTELQGS